MVKLAYRMRTVLSLLLGLYAGLGAQIKTEANDGSYLSETFGQGYFTLAKDNQSAPLCIGSQEYAGVRRAVKNLQTDLNRVTDALPELCVDSLPESDEIVLIGTLGKNPLIDKLVRIKKLDVTAIAGKWESFLIQTLQNPLPRVKRALVITGSDKRGTIYGVYDLSARIGVSPWYWWADVPVKKKADLYILPSPYISGEPKVKYRGIFINDEAPALSGWAFEKFGGFNADFYSHVFDLILRLKGNFLWPAMWGRAFYVDDPENPGLADECGIVIGTSHHEPMMRAHAEWARFGSGPWNYETNADTLRKFWTEGIRRMNNYESIVTLAMRGDGDEPMSPEANIALLQRIVNDQREILARVTGRDITKIPQVWALYKEVQEYYDKGMRVPDDVTLLLCDDNWGNIRRLPALDDKPRAGGYGIYYHYDYVGGPRNYKWLNTNQISRVWEQLHLAYAYGVNRLWIVNVGDIKPLEFPIEFFLEYAWNPDQWPVQRLGEYARHWAQEQFGTDRVTDIAEILSQYTRFNSRRKPELLSPDTYSLVNYREAETVVEEYSQLAVKAEKIYNALPAGYRDAFYQLVLYPVAACANLNELYVTAGKNRLYARQGRIETNRLAQQVRSLFEKDAGLSRYYNTELAGGKWAHLMDQTHIGYTGWQQPDQNVMPEVTEIENPPGAEMGIAVEGTTDWWPGADAGGITRDLVLPGFDPYNRQSYFIEIFNRGKKPFTYSVQPAQPWIKLNRLEGSIETEERLWVDIDWAKAMAGEHKIPIIISGPGQSQVVVYALIRNPSLPVRDMKNCFIENDGIISVEAEHYSRTVNSQEITWQCIPDLGRTLSGMTPFPVTVPSQKLTAESPHLEYRMYFFDGGDLKITAYLSPTLNFHHTRGLRYAISFDDQIPQIINMHQNDTLQAWEESVRNNITVTRSFHRIQQPGRHVLKFYAIDPGVVLQKLVVARGKIRTTYLGPPESYLMP